MKTTIALSLDRVLQTVYAAAALDSINTLSAKPEILGVGQAAALRRLACNCAAQIIMKLMPAVTGTNLLDSDKDPDIITIDFNIEGESPLLREALESALAEALLSTVWAGYDSGVAALHEAAMQRIIATTVPYVKEKPGRIAPAA